MKIRRIVSLILAIVIITACYSVFEISVNAVTNVSELVSALESGSGFTLVNDIDMAGQTVSSCVASNIIVEGNGYVIKNLTISGGLYTEISGTSTISNLALYNCTVVNTSVSNGSAHGLVCGKVTGNLTIKNCIFDGTISVGGSYSGTDTFNCSVGGMVGKCEDTATLNITDSATIVDIYEDISITNPHFNKRVCYFGGLVGYHGAGTVQGSYSTGTINNAHTYHYIGGMVGYSKSATYTDGYTSLFIEKAYNDSVKSIGFFENSGNLAENVYYDKTISIQRQSTSTSDSDADAHGIEPGVFATNLPYVETVVEEGQSTPCAWVNDTGLYPQRTTLKASFPSLSYISTARVDLNLNSFANGTGRDYMLVTVTGDTSYKYAVLANRSEVTWKICGGLDEYYFDPSDTTDPTDGKRSSAADGGLSGNAYDSDTGKYLFTTVGDISFTALNGNYSRTITVHVRKANPYITTISGSTCTITKQKELDNIRLYSMIGVYTYKINANLTLSDKFNPIADFRGTLNGNGKTISGLSVSTATTAHNAGLIGNISGAATIQKLFIKDASVTGDCYNAGVLAGKVDSTAGNVTVTTVIASGDVRNDSIGSFSKNAGMLIGLNEDSSLNVNNCATMGLCYLKASNPKINNTISLGGIIGNSNSGAVTDCYSTAVVASENKLDPIVVGGIIGSGSASATYCVFTGMLYNPSKITGSNKYSIASGTKTGSMFDKQSVGLFSVPSSEKSFAKKTSELVGITPTSGYWTSVSGKYPKITALNSLFSSACSLLSEPVTYSSNGISRSFNTATFTTSYTVTGPKDFAGNTNNKYSYSNGTFTTADSGIGLFNVSDTSSGTRKLLFNVKGVKLYYKFTYPNDNSVTKNAFKNDMNSYGLVKISNEFDDAFGLILDANQTTYASYVWIINSTDALTYVSTQLNSNLYSCTVTGGLDENSVGSLTDNTITFDDANEIYLNFNVESISSLWGIYYSNTTN